MSHVALTAVATCAAGVAACTAVPGPRARPTRHAVPLVDGGVPRAAGLETPLLRTTATLAVAMGAWVLLGGAVGAGAGVLAGGLCWRATSRLESSASRRRRETLTRAVPHVVDLMAACLAAGLSPEAALDQIVAALEPPVRDELAAVRARLRLGVDPGTVWGDLARHPQLGGLGRAVARAVESGASVADAMMRLAEDQRRVARADVEGRARAVGVRAAIPMGICLLPAFVLVGVIPLVAGSVAVLVGR